MSWKSAESGLNETPPLHAPVWERSGGETSSGAIALQSVYAFIFISVGKCLHSLHLLCGSSAKIEPLQNSPFFAVCGSPISGPSIA